eukprot:CAMPEP_0118631918 /NCGR_PEP_ID=MMETSP0785-20121206/161_1 /TAXON_ID=91992 /ORGANISM="Bolidomonas pacifica, Strain CCMP 1866" /LENGTH=146 /DNA_ID=CAMNT_0006522641 /DNA_START=519 /DNA_END=955 /DNA_ORIENTATION=+
MGRFDMGIRSDGYAQLNSERRTQTQRRGQRGAGGSASFTTFASLLLLVVFGDDLRRRGVMPLLLLRGVEGIKIVSASGDGKVRVWDVASGGDEYDLVYSRHTDWVDSAAWSPDGLKIASASRDREVRVWDVASGGDEVDLVYSRHT